jgi:hypothetical protein
VKLAIRPELQIRYKLTSIRTMATSKFRGLNVFIKEIRMAQNNAEKERKRIDKEMANIRQKFTSSKGLDSYNRKKYVWKMVRCRQQMFKYDSKIHTPNLFNQQRQNFH